MRQINYIIHCSASKDEKTKIIVEDTINYLNDEDNPFGSEKIWGYLNAKL